jgi:hypothetical protein
LSAGSERHAALGAWLLHLAFGLMQRPTKWGERRARPDARVAIVLSALLLPACDCFFGVRGLVTDCVTAAPLAAVGVDVKVDRGFQDRVESFPNETSTDPKGQFKVELNDPCQSWATLTFHRDGYVSVTPPQLRGHDMSDPPLDVCLNAAAP